MSKNLANCPPIESFRQFNRIKRAAEKWIKETDILGIRNRKVEGLQDVPTDNEVEAERIQKENAQKIAAQRMKNVCDLLEAMFETHAQETIELMALACFIEPEDANNHSTAFYLRNVGEMIADEDVLAFFTSLVQLEQIGIFS